MQHKLTGQEKEELQDLLTHPGIKPLLSEIDNIVTLIEHDIITLSLDSSNEKELILRKSRAEGARRLATAIKSRINSLKPSSIQKKG